MLSEPIIELAQASDAQAIALLSRDFIEHGIGWRWTPPRVRELIAAREVNVAVARRLGSLLGFGIMRYQDEEAHLMLLCVAPEQQRKGIGKALMRWLETVALNVGVGCIYLEARASNTAARAFYGRLGYREIQHEAHMYARREAGVRIAKDLWDVPAR